MGDWADQYDEGDISWPIGPSLEDKTKKILTELFFAGRESMKKEIEGKGRIVQLPVSTQILKAYRFYNVSTKLDYYRGKLSQTKTMFDFLDAKNREKFINDIPKLETTCKYLARELES